MDKGRNRTLVGGRDTETLQSGRGIRSVQKPPVPWDEKKEKKKRVEGSLSREPDAGSCGEANGRGGRGSLKVVHLNFRRTRRSQGDIGKGFGWETLKVEYKNWSICFRSRRDLQGSRQKQFKRKGSLGAIDPLNYH